MNSRKSVEIGKQVYDLTDLSASERCVFCLLAALLEAVEDEDKRTQLRAELRVLADKHLLVKERNDV